ncbi:MAG: OsmC family protein [Bacteroidetes bacterium]|nr:OsmC family protein [Bacteroidota bacterium]
MTKISEISYKGNLRVSSKHLQSGMQVITDAPTDNHGKGEAFSPTDLVSTALGNCMITLMGIAANTHNIYLGKIDAEVYKIMDINPRRIKEIKIDLKIENKNFTDKQKKILETAALNCPVAKSLSENTFQNISFYYY